jgi:hypothetical protein
MGGRSGAHSVAGALDLPVRCAPHASQSRGHAKPGAGGGKSERETAISPARVCVLIANYLKVVGVSPLGRVSLCEEVCARGLPQRVAAVEADVRKRQ